MRVEAWPYVVGRGFDEGYRTFLAPAFLAEHELYLLEYASSGDTTPEGTAVVREILGGSHSPMTLLYRVLRPTVSHYGLPGEHLLRDSAGRPITVFEGFVLRLPIAQARASEATDADFESLREAAAPIYRDMWKAPRETEPERTRPIAPSPDHAGRQLSLTTREPFLVPHSSATKADFEVRMTPPRSDTDATAPMARKRGKKAEAKYIAAVASLIAAVAGLITAFAVLLGGSQSSPRATTGPVTINFAQSAPAHDSEPAASPSATLSNIEQSLVARVTGNNYLSNCQPSTTTITNADFVLTCSAFGIRDTEVEVAAFSGDGANGTDATPGIALGRYLNGLLQQYSLTDPSGLCSANPFAGAGTWKFKDQNIGKFVCYQDNGSQVLVWTFGDDAWVEQNNNEQFAIIATDSDPSSGSDLWQWWQKLPV